ncbi:MAG: hypothetical protein ACK54K_07280, partial [Gemmatimonadaceae bacterium]
MPFTLLRRVTAAAAGSVLISASTLVAQTPLPLQRLLEDASRRNRLPDSLISYRATVETEVAVLRRREEGTEAVAAIEQVASGLRWNRAGQYEQRVTGYRAQQIGANVSMLSLFQTGWLNPVLYGNRLRIRSSTGGGNRGRRGNRADGADTLPAVHPLATDRDGYY